MIDCMTCLCVEAHCPSSWTHVDNVGITHGFVEGTASDPSFSLSSKLCELNLYEGEPLPVWGFRAVDEVFVIRTSDAHR